MPKGERAPLTFRPDVPIVTATPNTFGGYVSRRLDADLAVQPVILEIVKRTDKDGGFKVIRRRWVIERTFSWLRRNRRLMAHYEAIAIVAEGFAKLAMICVMLKRLTQTKPQPAS